MQVLNIVVENFKGIKLVELTPTQTTTIVGGKNRAGKSSLLDAVAATLGVAKLCPKCPIREGENEAHCSIKLDGDEARMLAPCTVTRRWKRKPDDRIVSELEIVTDDAYHYRAPTPQLICDDLVGPLGFDVEKFTRMTGKEQADVLRALVGLDFTQLDMDRKAYYDERTAVNRTEKQLFAQYEATSRHGDAPDEEVSVAALMTELRRRQAVNAENANVRRELDTAQAALMVRDREFKSALDHIKALELQLQQAQKRLLDENRKWVEVENQITRQTAVVARLIDENLDEVQEQISNSETVNRKVRENVERARLKEQVAAVQQESLHLTNRISHIDAEKQRLREAAKWPVPGLGYDEDGVTLFGRPFDQASATEQREAAFGIVAALNPTLQFAMIKDGSLLDQDSMADFTRIAAEYGFKLFVERVSRGKECTVVISEGELTDEREEM